MALTYGFYDSINGDRTYNAQDWSSIFNGIINDGVFMSIGDHLAVSPTTQGLSVKVGSGRAWFDSTWTDNNSDYVLSIGLPDISLRRIDTVVLETNKTMGDRANYLKVITGTPASTPVAPTLVNTVEIKQHALANILVKPEATTINQADITNLIGTGSTPFVTGILETMNIDTIVAQWEAEFGNWFESLQVILDGDVATRLANEILQLQNRATSIESNINSITNNGSIQRVLVANSLPTNPNANTLYLCKG